MPLYEYQAKGLMFAEDQREALRSIRHALEPMVSLEICSLWVQEFGGKEPPVGRGPVEDDLWAEEVIKSEAVKAPEEQESPCSHPSCYSHVTHPCEGCGRIGGQVRQGSKP